MKKYFLPFILLYSGIVTAQIDTSVATFPSADMLKYTTPMTSVNRMITTGHHSSIVTTGTMSLTSIWVLLKQPIVLIAFVVT
jgi:hypothetical protein